MLLFDCKLVYIGTQLPGNIKQVFEQNGHIEGYKVRHSGSDKIADKKAIKRFSQENAATDKKCSHRNEDPYHLLMDLSEP